MSAILNPYINLHGQAREALEFYRSVFGGKLSTSTFAEFQSSTAPADDDLVMHGQLEGEHGVVLMAADTPSTMEYRPGATVTLSLSGDDEPVLRGWFDALAAGGTVVVPMEKAPWGETFGMCVDRFGIDWMVNVSGGAQR